MNIRPLNGSIVFISIFGGRKKKQKPTIHLAFFFYLGTYSGSHGYQVYAKYLNFLVKGVATLLGLDKKIQLQEIVTLYMLR